VLRAASIAPCSTSSPAASGSDAHDNLILCVSTGVGKSWLACALGHQACRDNRSALYQRVPKLFADLALARSDGRYARITGGLNGVELLILDDWGLDPLDAGALRAIVVRAKTRKMARPAERGVPASLTSLRSPDRLESA
jgi:DNA replication protein DnaC